MKRIFLAAALCTALTTMFILPTTIFAENFENFSCFSGTYNIFSYDKKSPVIMSFIVDGLIVEENKKKMEKAVSFHCEGIQYNMGPKREGLTYCTLKDPDGDLRFLSETPTGETKTGKILGGTGKWKGATGTYNGSYVITGTPLKAGTFQRCGLIKGTYKLAK